jgi:beta-N-acetylhexosaminidase
VAGPCSGRIAPSRPIPFGDPTAVASFRVAAQEAGLRLGRVDLVKPPRPKVKKRWSKKRKQRVIRRWRAIEPRPVLRGTRVDLVGTGDPVPPSQYVVAVDTPYVLGRTSAAVRVATYGDGPGPMRALVAFWLGLAGAPGRLPVDVPGVPRRGC